MRSKHPDHKAACEYSDPHGPTLLLQLLLVLPILVQFGTFTLLVMFYAYWVHKSDWDGRYRKPFIIVAVAFNVIYVVLYGSASPLATFWGLRVRPCALFADIASPLCSVDGL